MRPSIIAALASILIATPNLAAQDSFTDTSFLPERGVVLSLHSYKHGIRSGAVIRIPRIAGPWTPTAREIQTLEPVLASVLKDSLLALRARSLALQHGRHPNPVPPLSDYYRQYVGILVDDRRLIFINGFHSSVLSEMVDSSARARGEVTFHWQTTPVIAIDGGIGFFGAIYDPDTKKVVQLGFNGYAGF